MFKRVLIFLLPWLLLSSSAWAQDQQATQQQLDRLKQEVAQVQQRIARQERERQDEQQALAQAERSIGRVVADLRTLDQELLQLDDDMQGLQSQRLALETGLAERRELIEQLIQEQYRRGRQPRLQLLLKQEDPERLDRMLRYYDYMNAELIEQLQAYQQQLNSLGTTRAQIGSTEQQIAPRRAQLGARAPPTGKRHVAYRTNKRGGRIWAQSPTPPKKQAGGFWTPFGPPWDPSEGAL